MLRTLPQLLIAALLVAPLGAQEAPAQPRNLVLMIADGFGPTSRTMGREMRGERLALDDIIIGSIGTSASNSIVTDSAASATAYASGVKTYNGAIGIDVHGNPAPTLLETAEKQGKLTGLVSTARITHATPACFAAHVAVRKMEMQIAEQELASGVDILMGGGRMFFWPKKDGGGRLDQKDLFAQASEAGWHVANTWPDLQQADALPLLALMTNSHMSYELDRDPELEPSLAQMTTHSLELLSSNAGEAGFFLMVEGGRIDHAGHANDPAAHAADILAYDDAVRVALDFATKHPDTLVVSVADHETGGMSLGRNVKGVAQYSWKPDELKKASHSIEWMVEEWKISGEAELIIREATGIETFSADETAQLAALPAIKVEKDRVKRFSTIVSELVSTRALIGWTSSGHTAADILLFAAGPGSDGLRGHHENDAFGRRLARVAGLEPSAD